MGAHPLYQLEMNAAVDGAISDKTSATFGVRTVSSHLTKTGLRPVCRQRQACPDTWRGWAPDMFLRDDPKRMEAEFSYVLNLGLNTIRSEGKLEDARFYDLADRNGIMILAGWKCCDKWESWAKTGGEAVGRFGHEGGRSLDGERGTSAAEPPVRDRIFDRQRQRAAARDRESVCRHPACRRLVAADHRGAVPQGTAETGPSGMKMAGPYSWIPPAYWYADKLGWRLRVRLRSQRRRLYSAAGRPDPHALAAGSWRHFWKRSAGAAVSRLRRLVGIRGRSHRSDLALAKRYGPPKSIEDYVAKSQLENYDNVRAQFEAFNARMDAAKSPSTGVIYWMLNNAWPSPAIGICTIIS